MDLIKTIAPPFVVLGFHPLLSRLGALWGGPDVPTFLMFIWSLALAIAVVKTYLDLKRKSKNG